MAKSLHFAFRPSSLIPRPSAVFCFPSSVILLLSSAACGGEKDNSTPLNVGGGYTLQVSGGMLNDGSGANGLVILATLRDKDERGPTLTSTWTITITGGDIPADSPITVDYLDPSQGSYMSYEWSGFDPSSGKTIGPRQQTAKGTLRENSKGRSDRNGVEELTHLSVLRYHLSIRNR